MKMWFQQFGVIMDVEIIFNERGSKVKTILCLYSLFTNALQGGEGSIYKLSY